MTVRRVTEFCVNGSKTNNHVSGEGSAVAALITSTLPNESWMQPLSTAGGPKIAIGGVNGTGGAGSAGFALTTAYCGHNIVLGTGPADDIILTYRDTSAALVKMSIVWAATVGTSGVLKICDSADAVAGTGTVVYANGDKIHISPAVISNASSATTNVQVWRYTAGTWVLQETISATGVWLAGTLARIDCGIDITGAGGGLPGTPLGTTVINMGMSYVDDAQRYNPNYIKLAWLLPETLGSNQGANFLDQSGGTALLAAVKTLDCKAGVNTGYTKNSVTGTQSLSVRMTGNNIPAGSTIYYVRFLNPFTFTTTSASNTVAMFATINGTTYTCGTTAASGIVANGVATVGGWWHGRGLCTDGSVNMTLAASSLTPGILNNGIEVGATFVGAGTTELDIDTFQVLIFHSWPAPGVARPAGTNGATPTAAMASRGRQGLARYRGAARLRP